MFDVPDGHCLLLGDNQDSSTDSSCDQPFLSRDQLVGRLRRARGLNPDLWPLGAGTSRPPAVVLESGA
jgi:hypothetical protein